MRINEDFPHLGSPITTIPNGSATRPAELVLGASGGLSDVVGLEDIRSGFTAVIVAKAPLFLTLKGEDLSPAND